MNRSKISKKEFSDQQNSMEELNGNIKLIKEILQEQNKYKENAEKEAANERKTLLTEIKCLKEIINNQNKTIVELLSEVKVLLKTTIVPGQVSLKYVHLFPIETVENFEEVENEITNETMNSMISTLKGIIGNNMQKELQNVLHISLILKFNVDGKQRKLRLLQYPKFIDCLYKAAFSDGLTKKKFLTNLRYAFRLAKNRHHKKESLKRQRSTSSSEESNN